MKYIIRDREAGNKINATRTFEEAENLVNRYEDEDKKEGTYTVDFYEIVPIEQAYSYEDLLKACKDAGIDQDLKPLIDFYIKSLGWSEKRAIGYTTLLVKDGSLKDIMIILK